MMRRLFAVALTLTLASSTMACAKLQVAYQPSTAAAAPASGVELGVKVVDARPADHGGSDKGVVGQTRQSMGIPSDLKDSDPAVVSRTVTEATNDALRRAGVGAGKGAKVLVATVKEFWLDGYVGYKGTVTVDYELRDGGGKLLWQKTLTGASGGSTAISSPYGMTQDTFRKALTELSDEAAKEFASPEFVAAAK